MGARGIDQSEAAAIRGDNKPEKNAGREGVTISLGFRGETEICGGG